MTARDLIEALEEFPSDCPVVVKGVEIVEVSEVFLRDEMYLSEDHEYKDGMIIKLY